MQKATEELQIKNAKQREIREFRQRNNLNIGTGYFIFNSANSPSVYLCFGILYIRLLLKIFNSKNIALRKKFFSN